MIGTQTLADVIATAVMVEDEDGFPVLAQCSIPEGFSWLGSGSERHAFLGPDGVVYKVTVSDPLSKYSNSNEWQNYCNLSLQLPKNVRFAECFLYFSGDIDVLAMEYIDRVSEGLDEYFDHEAYEDLVRQGWNDLHEMNCAVIDDTLVMIDYSR